MEKVSRIIFADQNEDFRLLMADSVVNESGIELIDSTGDGAQLIKLIGEKKPDVVVMDLILQNKDGISVLREYAGKSGYRPAFIIVSAFMQEKIVAESAALGAYYFISKPCDVHELFCRVREVAAESRSEAGIVSVKGNKKAISDRKIESMVTDVIH